MRRSAADTHWAVSEFAEAELGDVRRTTRLIERAGVLAQPPTAALPEACGDDALLTAASRFFAHAASEPPDVLESPSEATSRRLPHVPVVWAVHDTTEVDWTSHPATRGLGLGAPGPPSLSGAARPEDAGVPARASPPGAVGPTGLGPCPCRRGHAYAAQAAAHQPAGQPAMAPQSGGRVWCPGRVSPEPLGPPW
jgi:hypothetical protein